MAFFSQAGIGSFCPVGIMKKVKNCVDFADLFYTIWVNEHG